MKIKLKNIADITTGYQIRRRLGNSTSGTHKIIQMRNVCIDSGVLMSTENEYDSVTPNKPEKYKLKLDDIILTTRGNFNKASIIKKDKVDWIASGHFMILRVKEGLEILPEYLHLFLNLKVSSNYFAHEARGTGIKILSRKTIEELCIPVLPLINQKKIINFDKLCSKEIDLLELLIEKIFFLKEKVINKLLENVYVE